MSHIHCRLHKLLEFAGHARPTIRPGRVHGGQQMLDKIALLMRDLRADPMYIIAPDILRLLMHNESSMKSLVALAAAGLVHLPYPAMTVQFNRQGDSGEELPGTWFASLRERDDGVFMVRTVLMKPHYVLTCEEPTEVRCTAEAFGIETCGTEAEGYAAAIAVRVACLMTHIGGLDREHVPAPERLNKQREHAGKVPVRAYYYAHIGRVYDRDGKAHDYNKSGRHMPIHMRAGHTRNQPFGPERSERKLIWIPPVLVNYHPDAAERPVLERRIIR